MADSGELGTILHMEAHWSHDRWLGMAADNWRGSKEEAPAAGWTGMGVHPSDMMLSLAGEVVEVQAHVAKRILAIPTGDVVSAHFRFADGSTGSIAALSATPDYARFAVFGSLAWAEARETQHVDGSYIGDRQGTFRKYIYIYIYIYIYKRNLGKDVYRDFYRDVYNMVVRQFSDDVCIL